MSQGSIKLEVTNLHWLSHLDPTQDLCAHGDVVLEVNGRPVGQDDGDSLCVSAAAMNLLRSLERDHTQEQPISENLFPHCGHDWVLTEDDGLINISECEHGLDVEVRHCDGNVVITSPDGSEARVSASEWAEDVCAFADEVEAFYERSEPKDLSSDSLGWFEPFWEEWRRRRTEAGSA